MADQKTLVTEEGLQRLKDELDYLVTVKRPEIVQRIKVAREHGDLSENSEYDSAKEEQGFIESKIAQLEKQIKEAKIIAPDNESTDTVSIGKTVIFKEIPAGEQEEYTIVGSTESDPLAGKISHKSPLAIGLIDRKTGEKVKIQTPDGDIKVEILEVKVTL